MSIYPFFTAILGGMAVTLVVWQLGLVAREQVGGLLTRVEGANEVQLRNLFVPDMTARALTIRTLVAGLLLFVATWGLSGNLIIALAVGSVTAYLPKLYLSYLQSRRLEQFNSQLPGALEQLTGSLRAGLSLPQAIEECVQSTSSPTKEELQSILRDYSLGSSISDAIRSARARIPSRSFAMVAAALLVSIDRGGDLPQALERLTQSLTEIWRLEQKLTTATEEVRRSMLFVAATPLVLVLVLMAMQPDIPRTLTGGLMGYLILVAAAALYALGLMWARRILARSA